MWEGERVVRKGERVGGEGVNGVGLVDCGGGEGMVGLNEVVEDLGGRLEDLGIFGERRRWMIVGE